VTITSSYEKSNSYARSVRIWPGKMGSKQAGPYKNKEKKDKEIPRMHYQRALARKHKFGLITTKRKGGSKAHTKQYRGIKRQSGLK